MKNVKNLRGVTHTVHKRWIGAVFTGSCYTDVQSSAQSPSAVIFPWSERDCCRTAWWQAGCLTAGAALRSAPWWSRSYRSSWPAVTTSSCWPGTATTGRQRSTTAWCGCQCRRGCRRTPCRRELRPTTLNHLQSSYSRQYRIHPPMSIVYNMMYVGASKLSKCKNSAAKGEFRG